MLAYFFGSWTASPQPAAEPNPQAAVIMLVVLVVFFSGLISWLTRGNRPSFTSIMAPFVMLILVVLTLAAILLCSAAR